MNYLLVDKLSKSFGERIIFDDITFGLDRGQKAALVARNGTGKTTLMAIISGKDTPDSGQVVTRQGIRVGFLEQDPDLIDEQTVWETIFQQQNRITDAIRNYEIALSDFQSDNSNEKEELLSKAIQQMDTEQAWDFEVKVKQILTKLKIVDFDKVIGTLSGGQKKRVALAAVLLEEPDILILDEPTNHLDIDMIEWLEQYLSGSGITLFMVTHDRYFLDNVCTDVFELANNKLYRYKGNYAYYLEKKSEREQNEVAEVDRAKNLYRRELEWVRRMPKARGTKSKSRMDAFKEIKDKAFSLRQQKELQLDFRMKHLGNKIVELINIDKSYEHQQLIKKFNYSFRKGERIGIIGDNGTGKSTLLKLIMGMEEADGGKVIVGDTIEFGYYTQEGIKLKEDKRVIEVIKDITEVIEVDKKSRVSASQMLQRFDFSPEMQYNFVSKLSGGEKRRLYLLTVLLKNPNFLILDEPTNDLDILTLNKLEEYLEAFPGCMIIVSHDRYFLDKLVDQIFVFEGNGSVKVFGGSYSEYRIKKDEELDLATKEKKSKSVERKKQTGEKVKLSYKEKLEFEELEQEIPKLEQEKADISSKLGSEVNHEEMTKLTERLGEVVELIESKTNRWLELSEYT